VRWKTDRQRKKKARLAKRAAEADAARKTTRKSSR